MFTYWGDHGLGDSYRIPIGHGKEISGFSGNDGFIEPLGHKGEVLSIESFAVKASL